MPRPRLLFGIVIETAEAILLMSKAFLKLVAVVICHELMKPIIEPLLRELVLLSPTFSLALVASMVMMMERVRRG